jgi:hypothetical protein
MTSIGPYSQSYNFTHMFDIPDLRGESECKYPKDTIMGILSNKNLSKFRYIVKLARMDGILSHPQSDFTLFVPSDNHIKDLHDSIFVNMDVSVARHIVKSSMLDRKITSNLLQDSPASYFKTKNPINSLFVTNISGTTYINDSATVISFDNIASNGIVHVIDKLLIPEII